MSGSLGVISTPLALTRNRAVTTSPESSSTRHRSCRPRRSSAPSTLVPNRILRTQAVLVDAVLGVGLQLVPRRVGARPVRALLEGELVGERRDVHGDTGIRVPVPGSAGSVARLDHQVVADPGLVELDRGADAGEPGADDDGVVVGRCHGTSRRVGDDVQTVLGPQRQRRFEFYRMIRAHVECEALAHDRRHQHHLHQREALPDADAPPAAERQIRRPGPVLGGVTEKAGRVEDLGVGPPALVVVDLVDRDQHRRARTDVVPVDDVVLDRLTPDHPHRREVALRFLDAGGGPRQPASDRRRSGRRPPSTSSISASIRSPRIGVAAPAGTRATTSRSRWSRGRRA